MNNEKMYNYFASLSAPDLLRVTLGCQKRYEDGKPCEECIPHEDMSTFDNEETIENCTVKLCSNSDTGNVKISWWKNE